ncbi:uncharacterized protein LOC127288988 [Leptopilina boulardi]|uniref:uncharacterized protein LOC127288988 n=1 Tax=Leptopilina boulardi TaxID=63433 RepID=UPI0021F69B0C|nr:uncharacterized protein LOC127288988 [Leptopilina boulardi]
MMNETSLFMYSTQTFQFLSILSYTDKLSNIFYNQDLLESNNQFQHYAIINAYFEHLNRTNNEEEAKRRLVQNLLQGSDLYGGHENETLDMEYVDATFQYIISNIVFADYGNVYGYLAKIVNLANNLTLSFLKQNILEDLMRLEFLTPEGTISKLSLLSSVRIRDDFLLSLFPQPEKDMNITDIDYIYAQAGLIFAHSGKINTTNVTFNDFIVISQTLELAVLENTTNQSALTVFTLPALLFNASNEAKKFNQQYVADCVQNETFLAETLNSLFSYLNETFLTINREAYESSPFYQFNITMSHFKSRTDLAEHFLRQQCNLENETESAIDKYKLFASSSKCPNNESILLPNVDQVYQSQVDVLQEKYHSLMEILLQQVFSYAGLVDLINSTKTAVYESQTVPIPTSCFPYPCPPYQPRLNPNIYLFALRTADGNFYYALDKSGSNLNLLYYNSDPEEFLNKIGLPPKAELEISAIPTILKHSFETYETFIDRLARLKAKEFANQLYSTGYEKTFKEKIVDVLVAFVPFYNCIKFAKAGDNVGASFSCISDVISWIPFGGQLLQLSSKLGTMTFNHLLLATGVSVKTFTTRQAIRISMEVGLYEASSGLAEMVKNVIFTKEMFKNLFVGLVRTVDPGFELVGRLHWKGGLLLGKLFKKTWTVAAKKYPLIKVNFPKEISQQLSKASLQSADDSGMIPVLLGQRDGYDVFRYTYPGGEKTFGPKFLRLPNTNAELRQVMGFNAETPVVVSRINKYNVYYKKIDLKTQNTYGLELELNGDGLLQPVRAPFREHIATIVREGLSGRGALKLQRETAIREATLMILKSNTFLSRSSIISYLRHYILAFERPLDMQEDLSKIIIDPVLINQIEEVNPSSIKQLLGKGPLIVDPSLNNYLVVPTYRDFALDWVRTQNIHDTYEKFHVLHSNELERLRTVDVFDSINVFDLASAKKLISFNYGDNFQELLTIDLASVLSNYDSYNARFCVDFPDYFGILVYIQNAFKRSISNDVKRHMSRALFRLAVRQTDEEIIDFPKKIFFFERKSIKQINENMFDSFFRNGKSFTIGNFQRVSTQEKFVDRAIYNLFWNNNIIPVKYEIHLDEQFLAVNLARLISLDEEKFVIFPFTEFHLDEVIEKVDSIHVKMHNLPISKELWLVRLMKHRGRNF